MYACGISQMLGKYGKFEYYPALYGRIPEVKDDSICQLVTSHT